MDTGDWVFTTHEGNKITGFVTGIENEYVDILVTVPRDYGTISMPMAKVWNNNEILISPDDIPSLIDLSLLFKDKEWFKHWVHELSLWKPVESFTRHK